MVGGFLFYYLRKFALLKKGAGAVNSACSRCFYPQFMEYFLLVAVVEAVGLVRLTPADRLLEILIEVIIGVALILLDLGLAGRALGLVLEIPTVVVGCELGIVRNDRLAALCHSLHDSPAGLFPGTADLVALLGRVSVRECVSPLVGRIRGRVPTDVEVVVSARGGGVERSDHEKRGDESECDAE